MLVGVYNIPLEARDLMAARFSARSIFILIKSDGTPASPRLRAPIRRHRTRLRRRPGVVADHGRNGGRFAVAGIRQVTGVMHELGGFADRAFHSQRSTASHLEQRAIDVTGTVQDTCKLDTAGLGPIEQDIVADREAA